MTTRRGRSLDPPGGAKETGMGRAKQVGGTGRRGQMLRHVPLHALMLKTLFQGSRVHGEILNGAGD